MRRILAILAGAAVLTVAPATAAMAKPGHQSAAGADPNCALSTTGVGAPLYVTGSGYQPGGNYQVYFHWPQSASGVSGSEAYVTADTSGAIMGYDYAYWAGTYTAQVMSGSKTLATCSTTVS